MTDRITTTKAMEVKDFFNVALSEVYNEDIFDSRSEDSKYYDAVEMTCDEFGITEKQFDECLWLCKMINY